MAINTETGDLNRCTYCGKPLELTGGTDPKDADNHFKETYECPNGHVGRYEWDARSGTVTQRFTGACRE